MKIWFLINVYLVDMLIATAAGLGVAYALGVLWNG